MGSSNLLYKVPWLEDIWSDETEAEDGAAPEAAVEPEITRPQERTLEEFVEDLARERANYLAEAKVIELREKELREKRRVREARAEFLKKRALQEMLIAGTKKVKTPEFTVFWFEREAGPEVVNLDQLPAAFVRIKAEPNKKALNEHYKKTGELPPGTELGEPTKTIVFK